MAIIFFVFWSIVYDRQKDHFQTLAKLWVVIVEAGSYLRSAPSYSFLFFKEYPPIYLNSSRGK